MDVRKWSSRAKTRKQKRQVESAVESSGMIFFTPYFFKKNPIIQHNPPLYRSTVPIYMHMQSTRSSLRSQQTLASLAKRRRPSGVANAPPLRARVGTCSSSPRCYVSGPYVRAFLLLISSGFAPRPRSGGQPPRTP